MLVTGTPHGSFTPALCSGLVSTPSAVTSRGGVWGRTCSHVCTCPRHVLGCGRPWGQALPCQQRESAFTSAWEAPQGPGQVQQKERCSRQSWSLCPHRRSSRVRSTDVGRGVLLSRKVTHLTATRGNTFPPSPATA